uniref:Uncharacterized protein n=2 Tax=Zea mays TaxID=4577 RepID=A0A804LDS9_MAIZE
METHDLGTGPVKLNSSFDEMPSADVPASTQPPSVPPGLVSDESKVDFSHSAVKAFEHQSHNP